MAEGVGGRPRDGGTARRRLTFCRGLGVGWPCAVTVRPDRQPRLRLLGGHPHGRLSGAESPDTLWFVRIWGVVAALTVSVALAGCSDDPEPRTLPPVESASPTPSVVPMPSEAAAETPEGAAAFARYFFDVVVNDGFSDSDSTRLRVLSHPECGGCNNLIEAVEEDVAPGERIEGGLFDVIFAEAPPVEAGDVIVDLRYAVSELRVLDEDGKVVRRTPAEAAIDAQLRLIRRGSGWVVRGFRNVST